MCRAGGGALPSPHLGAARAPRPGAARGRAGRAAKFRRQVSHRPAGDLDLHPSTAAAAAAAAVHRPGRVNTRLRLRLRLCVRGSALVIRQDGISSSAGRRRAVGSRREPSGAVSGRGRRWCLRVLSRPKSVVSRRCLEGVVYERPPLLPPPRHCSPHPQGGVLRPTERLRCLSAPVDRQTDRPPKLKGSPNQGKTDAFTVLLCTRTSSAGIQSTVHGLILDRRQTTGDGRRRRGRIPVRCRSHAQPAAVASSRAH